MEMVVVVVDWLWLGEASALGMEKGTERAKTPTRTSAVRINLRIMNSSLNGHQGKKHCLHKDMKKTYQGATGRCFTKNDMAIQQESKTESWDTVFLDCLPL